MGDTWRRSGSDLSCGRMVLPWKSDGMVYCLYALAWCAVSCVFSNVNSCGGKSKTKANGGKWDCACALLCRNHAAYRLRCYGIGRPVLSDDGGGGQRQYTYFILLWIPGIEPER